MSEGSEGIFLETIGNAGRSNGETERMSLYISKKLVFVQMNSLEEQRNQR